MARLKDQIAALEASAQSDPVALIALAQMALHDGQHDKVLTICRKATTLAPQDARITAEARFLIGASIPHWHFAILRDSARNLAYDNALRRAVASNSKVLEIGTGTGLLAMMAARAGAATVVTCEAVPAIADKAAEIISFNGYQDRVKVIAKRSTELVAEIDMGGRADILVSEIISNNLLGQKVLDAYEHAVLDLLKPEAQIIPVRGTVRVALAYSERDTKNGLTDIAGFDLSPFNEISSARQIPVGDRTLSLRSDAADLFVFNFASANYCAPSHASVICNSAGGTVSGVVQWIMLELDDAIRYENRPQSGATSCWSVLYYPFSKPLETAAGKPIRVHGSHDRENLVIWTDEAIAEPA